MPELPMPIGCGKASNVRYSTIRRAVRAIESSRFGGFKVSEVSKFRGFKVARLREGKWLPLKARPGF
jgi:hypothetical protein